MSTSHPHAKPHAHIHAQTRVRERRHQLATEAARLMIESQHLPIETVAKETGLAT